MLESERYWDRARHDDLKYLTWWQILVDVYIRHKDKIKLKEYKVFLKKFERDNLTDRASENTGQNLPPHG